MSQHDKVLEQIKAALGGIELAERPVSGYTGHYLPDGRFFYVGTPKSDGPVRITTCVEIPGKQPPWMPRGTVRSAFMSDDAGAIAAMVEALKLPGSKPARKSPSPRAAAAVVPAPAASPTDAELASKFDVSEEELERLTAPLANN